MAEVLLIGLAVWTVCMIAAMYLWGRFWTRDKEFDKHAEEALGVVSPRPEDDPRWADWAWRNEEEDSE